MGICTVALNSAGSPVLWACFWCWHACMLAIYAVITWRRTGLLCVALAGAYGSMWFVAWIVVSAVAGYTPQTLPGQYQLFYGIAAAVIPVLYGFGCWKYREQFRIWKAPMGGMTVWDLLRFRHIPHLR